MIFIRFLDDIQVEAIQRNTSPGDDWLEGPENFNWNKMHKLVNGEIVEMPDDESEPATNVAQKSVSENVDQEQFAQESASIGETHA
jgi:hypothetical protein